MDDFLAAHKISTMLAKHSQDGGNLHSVTALQSLDESALDRNVPNGNKVKLSCERRALQTGKLKTSKT